MLGNVGEGSRGKGKDRGWPSGMLTRPLREEELESVPLPVPFRLEAEMPLIEAEDIEERCPREPLWPCARALTAWMTVWASGPS